MYTVDIDTGGTMTDGLVADGSELHAIKVDTTPHDFTVSFRQVLVEAARLLGYEEDVAGFLDHVSFIRWSSTITSNVLGEGTGAKVGLLVRHGHEGDLYGAGPSPAVGTLVAEHNVIGLPENPTEVDVLTAVKRLFEEGVRRICVSLDGAFPDNASERTVAGVIEAQYPDHYLGAVPVVMGSEMAQVHDDATRTHCSLINAYTHTRLASALFQAEDMLKYDEGWDGPLLVGHINGGVARVGKTKALDTIESGPVFGTYASAYLARRYALSDVLCLDVGGTTAKASVVLGGEPMFTRDGDIFDISVRASLPLLRSAVLGGGSVARPVDGGGVRLGPDSMGAAPGPACYGLGGDQATVTDAFLILGYLDPTRFLGGRRTLDLARAEEALTKQLAEPLGVSAEEAATIVADTAVGMVADLVSSTLGKAGLDAADVTLFAYGGNGSMFAAPVAERLGISTARVFGLGPVFAAFGSSVADVVHVYERSLAGISDARAAADDLVATARRDLEAEGFDPDAATIEVELDLAANGSAARPGGSGASPGRIVRAGTIDDALSDAGGGHVEVARIRARFPVGAYEPVGHPSPDASTAPPPLVRRPVMLRGARHHTAVYDWASLIGRAAVEGPALAVGETMTCLVPPGWSLAIDEFANGVLRKA
ncbi:MAG: acetophenone carboxylase [Actinomycetota bacterium]|jgi:N-methylhydantoinase A/oxoprolinase/acetone carboxylase beta subunit|nr:acetophenone carboxylase [Actinomycetota bacterium]